MAFAPCSENWRARRSVCCSRRFVRVTVASGFEPRGEWERRLHLIGAADHQAVGEVDAVWGRRRDEERPFPLRTKNCQNLEDNQQIDYSAAGEKPLDRESLIQV
jgi:hypothetical protein